MADGAGTIRRDQDAVGDLDLPYSGNGRMDRTLLVRRVLLLLGPLVLLIGAGFWWFTGGRYSSTDDAYVQANTVSLATDVSGTVSDVDVADNQAVTAGQVLFHLDPLSFQIALDRAKAQLAVVRTDVESLKARYAERQEEIHLAQVNGAFAQREFTRASSLFHSRVVSQDQLDRTQHDLDASREQLSAQQQQLAMIAAALGGNPQLPVDQYPQVQAALAAVAAAQRDLDHATVRAPDDGIVSNVPNLRPGTYLPAGAPAFSLVSTAHSWVEAELKETDLTWVKPGQPVSVVIDTYPSVTWTGHVASVSPASGAEFSVLPAQNSSGNWVKVVQRIPVRIDLDVSADQPPLRAGMSAEISIDTGHRRALPSFLAFFIPR